METKRELHRAMSLTELEAANIFQDFFKVQAEKHGKIEMMKALHNVGSEAKSMCMRNDVLTSELSGGLNNNYNRRDVNVNLVKIEEEAENIIKGGDKNYIEVSKTAPAVNVLLLSDSETQKLQSFPQPNNGSIIPLMSPQSFFTGLFLCRPDSATIKEEKEQYKEKSPREVSVIQRVPSVKTEPPKIILEKRISSADSQRSLNQWLETKKENYLSLANGPTDFDLHNDFVTSRHQNTSKQKSNQQQSDHLICEVCGERAGKHSYYGGQVCPSCRAFFRRSVQSKYNLTFKCTKGTPGHCKVNILTRKNCQFCRYSACLKAGMRPSWILSEDERRRRFQGRCVGRPKKDKSQIQTSPKELMDIDETQAKLEIDIDDRIEFEPYKGEKVQDQEIAVKEGLSQQQLSTLLKYAVLARSCFSTRQAPLASDVVMQLVETISQPGATLTPKAAVLLHQSINQRTNCFISLIPEFAVLPPTDKVVLLEANLPLLHRFRQTITLAATTSDLLTWKDLVIQYLGPEAVSEGQRSLPHDLSQNYKNSKQMFSYLDFFTASPWVNGEEEEDNQLALMEDIAGWLDVHDEVQVILLALILIFNHDFLDLKDRDQVEAIQLKYVVQLQSHLRSLDSGAMAASHLAKAVMLPAVMRQIHQITKDRLII